jgi:carboxyl-terminal processing protease
VRLDTPALGRDAAAEAEAAFDRLAGLHSVILDVRRNGGGDEAFAARLLGRFVTEPVVCARRRVRDPLAPGTSSFGPAAERVLAPHANERWKSTRLFVLQGPYCVSSTEGLLLMAKAAPRVTTLGLASRGASGNPGPFALSDGAYVNLSRWQSLDLAGDCIEGDGVPPDVEVAHTPTDANPDPALAAAILRARTQ